jgi:hypothetical protein
MRPVQPSVVPIQRHVMLSAVPSSGTVNSVIRITGIGDQDRPEWLIRVSGMRSVWGFTKTILATAALRLVEQGHLSLDEQLPEQRYTLRQLLMNTSGLQDYAKLKAYEPTVRGGDTPWPGDEMLERVAAELPPFEPKTTWAYSSTGYYIVRRHIERIMDCFLGEALNRSCSHRSGSGGRSSRLRRMTSTLAHGAIRQTIIHSGSTTACSSVPPKPQPIHFMVLPAVNSSRMGWSPKCASRYPWVKGFQGGLAASSVTAWV